MPGGLHLHRSQLTRATPAEEAPGRVGARPLAFAAGVAGLAWALAAVSHAAGIPRTDDWGWARVAMTLSRTGHVRLVGWGPMTMLGLVAWAQPFLAVFGRHVWALDLSASVLVAAGLVGAWRLARTLGGQRGAVAVAVTLAVMPGFVRDAGSFMTDGPAFALGTLALLAGLEAAGADGRRRRWLEAACVGCGLWAFSIRELAVAAPLAVLAARWAAERGRRRLLGAEVAAVVAGSVAFWAWRSSLSGGQPYGGRPPVFTVAELLVCVVFTCSLLLVPVLAATAPSWWPARDRVARAGGMVAGVALAVVPIAYEPGSWNHRFQWLTGDYLDPRGLNGDKLLLGSRPRVVPALGWAAVEAVAIVAGVVVLGLVAEAVAGAVRTRPPARPSARPPARPSERPSGRPSERPPTGHAIAARALSAHVCLALAFVAVAVVRNGAVYDRYLWPVVLSGAVLLVATFPVPPWWEWHPAASQAALVVVTAFALVSLLVTLNSDAFDAARWRAAQQATGEGVAATAVDGGFEWTGWHAAAVADTSAGGDATRPYWVAMVGEPSACVELSASPVPDPALTLLGVSRWRTWLVFGRARLYAYRRPTACPGGARPVSTEAASG